MILRKVITKVIKGFVSLYEQSALKVKEDDMYKVRLIKEEVPMKEKKEIETMLKDILKVLPTLKKHRLDGELHTKIKTLRSGRKQKHYTLELSRKINTYEGLEPKIEMRKYEFPKRAKQLGLPSPVFEFEEVAAQKPVTTEIKVSAPLTKEEITIDGTKKRVPVNKTKVLAELKSQIIDQIRANRKKMRPEYEQGYPGGRNYNFTVPKLGDVYLEPGSFVKVIDRKLRFQIVEGKRPTEKNANYFGIEVEFSAKETREVLCDKLHAAGLSKYLHVHGDGSVNKDKDYPHAHEVSILVKQEEMEDVVTRFCNVLNKECNIRIDKSCGLHVHIDMRNRDVAKSFHNLIMMQSFLFAMVPANRKINKYSVPVQDPVFAPQNIINRDPHYDAVSSGAYNKYKTLELRMHCGTSQAKKIIGWVNFIKLIADAPKITSTPKNLKSIQDHLKMTDAQVEYCESRIAKFEKQHKDIADKKPKWLPDVEPVFTSPDRVSLDEQSEVA